MRRLLVAAGCGFAVFVVAPVSFAGSPRVPCGPAAAHTLAVSSGARVYSRAGSVYGCAPRRRSIMLGSATICNGVGRAGPAAAAGVLAAYALERCGVDTGSTTVIVRRLSDGKEIRQQQAWTLAVGPESYVSVGSVAVNRSASIAWIASEDSIVSHVHGVEVAERTGRSVRMLDSGSGIAVGSLRLRGRTLTWRDGIATRSATLN